MVGKKKECFGVQRAAYSKSVMRRSYRRWCMYLKISLAAYRDACKSENNPNLSKKNQGFPRDTRAQLTKTGFSICLNLILVSNPGFIDRSLILSKKKLH